MNSSSRIRRMQWSATGGVECCWLGLTVVWPMYCERSDRSSCSIHQYGPTVVVVGRVFLGWYVSPNSLVVNINLAILWNGHYPKDIGSR